MHAGQAAAVGVDGQAAAWRNGAAAHKGAAFTLLAKAQVFQEKNGIDGEGVVKLDDVDVLGAQAGHGIGGGAGLSGSRDSQVVHGRYLPVPAGGCAAQHVDGRVGQVAGAVCAHQHVGARAVGYQAAV